MVASHCVLSQSIRFEIDEYTSQTAPIDGNSLAHSTVPKPTMTQAQTSTHSLAINDRGQGPTIVILHGLFGSADNLGQIAGILAENHRVLSMDLPGHGQSPHTHDYGHEAMANIVINNLIERGVSQCAIIGHSLGGKIGMAIASAAEVRDDLTVTALIAIDIAPRDYEAHHEAVFNGLNAVPLTADMDRRGADEILSKHIDEASVRAFLLKSFRRSDTNAWHWRFDVRELQAQYSKLSLAPSLPETVLCPTLFIKGALSDYILPID